MSGLREQFVGRKQSCGQLFKDALRTRLLSSCPATLTAPTHSFVFAIQQFRKFLIAYISFVGDCKELKIAQTTQIN